MGDPAVADPSDLPQQVADERPFEPTDAPRELNLDIDSDFIDVVLPYPKDEYVCPACQQSIPTRKQITLSKPARFAHLLNDIMKCPHCTFIFSYKTTTTRVLRS